MRQSNSIRLSKPCTVSQDQLVDISTGSYCHACEKQVVDYSGMSDQELVRALRQNPTGCGSFRKDQLERPLIENELVRRGYSLAAIALLLALQLCSLKISGQVISPNAHIGNTTAVSTKHSASQSHQTKDLNIRELSVIDDEGYVLSYATVAILNSASEIIGGEATDSTGTVFLKLTDQAESIRVSYIGYQHQKVLLEELEENVVELHSLSSRLPEATVTAYRADNIRGGFDGVSSYWITSKTKDQKHDSPADPDTKLNLFPNPSTGQSTLKSELVKDGILVNVYSSVGQLIMSVPIIDGTSPFIQLQLNSQFPSGNYIVELVHKTGSTEVTKWMVAR